MQDEPTVVVKKSVLEKLKKKFEADVAVLDEKVYNSKFQGDDNDTNAVLKFVNAVTEKAMIKSFFEGKLSVIKDLLEGKDLLKE